MATDKADMVDQQSGCHCATLRKASRCISQIYDAVLAPSGLKATQLAILVQIRRSEPTTVSALAATLVMDAGGLTHTLKPLKRHGLVEISIDPEDRRHRLIRLTPAGRTKLAESDALWDKAQRGFETAYGSVEAGALREALRILVSGNFIETFERAISESSGDLAAQSSAR